MKMGYAWEKLTHVQLSGAHADLLNAALVSETAGWVSKALVDIASGSVCTLGAIETATYKPLRTGHDPKDDERYYYLYALSDHADDSSRYRAEIATTALSQVLPDDLCEQCSYDRFCVCGCGARRDAWELVVHYNDEHCPGGIAAAEMLRTAARNALLESCVRRDVRRMELVNA